MMIDTSVYEKIFCLRTDLTKGQIINLLKSLVSQNAPTQGLSIRNMVFHITGGV